MSTDARYCWECEGVIPALFTSSHFCPACALARKGKDTRCGGCGIRVLKQYGLCGRCTREGTEVRLPLVVTGAAKVKENATAASIQEARYQEAMRRH